MSKTLIKMHESAIEENEREIAKLETQLAPLQEAADRACGDLEAAEAFFNSCEWDYEKAASARDRVAGHIAHRKRILKRDNDMLDKALRSRREDEKKAERKAAREAKRAEREAA